jgi:hypothetical protein
MLVIGESCPDLKTYTKKPSQDIYSMLIYVINNMQLYTINKGIHNHNTSNNGNLHAPNTNLTKFQKGAHYMRII